MYYVFTGFNGPESKNIEILRFTRSVFSLTQSPFILEGTLKKHFDNYRKNFKKLIKIIENDMYVDDLLTGGNSLEKVKEIKQNSVQLFKKGGFNLRKWNSTCLNWRVKIVTKVN